MRDDARWNVLGKKLPPPVGNANFGWVQHFLFHLAPTGQAGFVLSKGSLTSQTNNEGEIRKALVENKLIDCIVNMPTKLFLNTQIPACLWFMSRNRTNGRFRNRENEILFLDARNMGFLVNKRNRDLTEKDIETIAGTYHNWRNKEGDYKDVQGFCKSATVEEVAKLNYVLTPGRFVGLPDDEDDFIFIERFTQLKEQLDNRLQKKMH